MQQYRLAEYLWECQNSHVGWIVSNQPCRHLEEEERQNHAPFSMFGPCYGHVMGLPWWLRRWRVFLPMGQEDGQRSLVGYSSWGRKELDMAEWLTLSFHFHFNIPYKVFYRIQLYLKIKHKWYLQLLQRVTLNIITGREKQSNIQI